ncbi:hypothetical protein TAMC210_00890 [Thermanaeromonas sp. C210]|nr:hypothetical protein TAMC210_00890 [Thermanaeromonas sp. C210]
MARSGGSIQPEARAAGWFGAEHPAGGGACGPVRPQGRITIVARTPADPSAGENRPGARPRKAPAGQYLTRRPLCSGAAIRNGSPGGPVARLPENPTLYVNSPAALPYRPCRLKEGRGRRPAR